MIKVGDIFLLLGIWMTILLLYQASSCADSSCIFIFVSLSSTVLFLSIVIFVVAVVFGMGMLNKKRK
jgi:hypothetical protein